MPHGYDSLPPLSSRFANPKRRPPGRDCAWCGRPKPAEAKPGKCVICHIERDQAKKTRQEEQDPTT